MNKTLSLSSRISGLGANSDSTEKDCSGASESQLQVPKAVSHAQPGSETRGPELITAELQG